MKTVHKYALAVTDTCSVPMKSKSGKGGRRGDVATSPSAPPEAETAAPTSAAERCPIPRAGHVLVLRTCAADMSSHSGFVWPTSGPVECPDWSPAAYCGQGLHGWLWGEGNASQHGPADPWAADARWLASHQSRGGRGCLWTALKSLRPDITATMENGLDDARDALCRFFPDGDDE